VDFRKDKLRPNIPKMNNLKRSTITLVFTLQVYYFMCQVLLSTSCRLVYRINVTYASAQMRSGVTATSDKRPLSDKIKTL